jgi:integrase
MFERRVGGGRHVQKAYYIRFGYERQIHYKWLGTISREAAEDFLKQYREAVVFDSFNLTCRTPALKPKFDALIQEYRKDLIGRNRESKTAFMNLKRFSPFLGKKEIHRVSKEDVKAARDALTGTVSNRSLKNSFSDLSVLFNFAKRQNYVRVNFISEVSKGIVPEETNYFEWHPNEDELILQHLEQSYEKAGFLLSLELGLRMNSVRSIPLSDIQFQRDSNNREYVRVCVRTLKGNVARAGSKKPEYKISYESLLLEALKKQQAWAVTRNSRWLFPGLTNPSRFIAEKYFRLGFQRACKKVFGETDVKPKFHHIRHVFNTRAKAMIPNESYVKATMSHESNSASAIYTHLTSEIGSDLSKENMAIYSEKMAALRRLPRQNPRLIN